MGYNNSVIVKKKEKFILVKWNWFLKKDNIVVTIFDFIISWKHIYRYNIFVWPIYMYIYVDVYIYVCIYIDGWIDGWVDGGIYMYIYVYVWICICMCIYVYICVYIGGERGARVADRCG